MVEVQWLGSAAEALTLAPHPRVQASSFCRSATTLPCSKPPPIRTMSAIGPELPPHLLAKRKRKQKEQAEDEDTATSGAKRSPSLSAGEKRRRVMGPAMPPAPLDERPSEPSKPSEDSDSDDDDGFGPSLPPVGAKVQCKRLDRQD